jgi:adenylate cyclase
MLVEFQSVTEALTCAADFQRAMAQRNRDVSPARALQYRIGINLGDVIVQDNDIFGDGVNVAARLEAMAEPGGICVSAAVRDQVGDRLEIGFEDLGEQAVKNINRAIHVFRVRLEPGGAQESATPDIAPSAATRLPSIAILPFDNMSGDPEQEFFADGLTEDIITEIARFRDLLVISRNAVFVHKGKPKTAKGIAKEFGVDYVVEGSVRKAADRVRVTVQLIDGETEAHVWAQAH